MPSPCSTHPQRPLLQPTPQRRHHGAVWAILALALALALTLAAPLARAATEVGLGLMRAVAERALDDPRAAQKQVRQKLAETPPSDSSTAFWLRLAQVDVLVHTDQEAASRVELAAAAQALPVGAAASQPRLWLQHFQRYLDTDNVDLVAFLSQQTEAREQARAAGDEALLCRLELIEAVAQVEMDAVDEAWAALEALERCAIRLGDAGLRAHALGTMGPVPAVEPLARSV